MKCPNIELPNAATVTGRLVVAAVAAYNAGLGDACQGMPGNPDLKSTGGDYSNDVIARAQYLQTQGW